jgi:hypothetical protein
MTLGRVTLTANEREPMILGPDNKAIYRLAELRLLGHRAVQRVTFIVVVLILFGAPA